MQYQSFAEFMQRSTEEGLRIYNEKYRAECEASRHGDYIAINVKNGEAAFGKCAEIARAVARETYPDGLFHLIHIGHESAYSYRSLPRTPISTLEML